ncbi:MAG: hypothetical protein VCA55_00705 [Verrucomicrobiales bacterium]
MSKSSSRSEPVEFQFELDIGESVPPEPLPQLKKADEDSEEGCIILKRKAEKPEIGKASGDLESKAKETEPGHEPDKVEFKPRKLDGMVGSEDSDSSGVDALASGITVRRERRELEGLKEQRETGNTIAGLRHGWALRHCVSLYRDLAGRVTLVQRARNKVVIAIILTVTALGLMWWLLIPSAETERLAMSTERRGATNAADKAGIGAIAPPGERVPGGLLKAQSGESDADMEFRAGNTLKKFFKAENVSEMMRFIRDPERVEPLTDDYYSRRGFAMPGLSEIVRFQEIMINLKVFLIADIILEGEGAHTVVLQDTGRGFVVDWETYVCYNPMEWDDFYRNRPQKAISFRVLATLDHNPGFAFPGQAEWICIRMIGRDSDEEIYGYVREGTNIALRIQEMLEDEWEFPCILKLQFPEQGKGGDRQVHIRDLIIENWIKVG